ncbi:tetratricopeptide repeat protein, partial [Streptomyces sp. ISL-99]|uniref:tetratricopeptide repeat protein n=1 Tax=Streptomyces sp. ISL-99 TaxID=2819193 RepID=UPI002034D177
ALGGGPGTAVIPAQSTGPVPHPAGGPLPGAPQGYAVTPGAHASPGSQPGSYATPGAQPGSYAGAEVRGGGAGDGVAYAGTQAAVPAPVTVPQAVAPPGAAPGVGAGGVPALSPYLAPLKAGATALALPVPRVDPDDPNAGFLAGLLASAPAELIAALQSAPADSVERRLRELRARLEMDERATAAEALYALELQHPDDWRVVWYRGIASLASGDNEIAALSFDAVYDAFPGEAAPKLALAVCAEVLGQLDNAAEYYRLVWATDPSYVSAAFGLARVQLAAGDRTGAVRTLESVPEASIHYTAARVAAVRARLRRRAAQDALIDDLTAAAAQVEALDNFGLDAVRREQLSTEVLGTALDWVLSGGHGARPAQTALLGSQLDERGLRFGLERSYRVLARLAQRGEERIDLVERANRFRPRTWV